MKISVILLHSVSHNNLNTPFLYKVEDGENPFDWETTSIPLKDTLYYSNLQTKDMYKSIILEEYLGSLANSKGEINLKSINNEDVSIEFLEMKSIESNESLDIRKTAEETEEITIEYYQIPKLNNRINYLFRFTSPVTSEIFLKSSSCFDSSIRRDEEGRVVSTRRHMGIREIIIKSASSDWTSLVKNIVGGSKGLDLSHISTSTNFAGIKKVNLVEQEMVVKDMGQLNKTTPPHIYKDIGENSSSAMGKIANNIKKMIEGTNEAQ